jgi:hypothetical protein
MVRRGSTVRVRQRALQKRRKSALLFAENLHDLQRAVGMEPFMEPSGSEDALEAGSRFSPVVPERVSGDSFGLATRPGTWTCTERLRTRVSFLAWS